MRRPGRLLRCSPSISGRSTTRRSGFTSRTTAAARSPTRVFTSTVLPATSMRCSRCPTPAGEAPDPRWSAILRARPLRPGASGWCCTATAGAWFEGRLPVKGTTPRTVRITQSRPGHGLVTVAGRPPSALITTRLMATVRQVLSLDQDLSPFYRLARDDPQLSWVERGAGRMVRSPTVFEDVVKTICTTNCAWSATTRMVYALVGKLGEGAPGAPVTGPFGSVFLTPAAMAGAGDTFYKNVAGVGYRGAYLRALAGSVESGEVDLEGTA